MSRHQQNIFYQFFKEGAQQKLQKAAEVLQEDFVYPKDVDKLSDYENQLNNQLTELIQECFSAEKQLDVELIYKLNCILHKKHLKLSRFFCKLQLSLGIAGMFVMSYAIQMD